MKRSCVNITPRKAGEPEACAILAATLADYCNAAISVTIGKQAYSGGSSVGNTMADKFVACQSSRALTNALESYASDVQLKQAQKLDLRQKLMTCTEKSAQRALNGMCGTLGFLDSSSEAAAERR